MAVISAGLLLYRRRGTGAEVFLVHPGGPYWVKQDEGAWSVPKGLVDSAEAELACARREFTEETGFELPGGGGEVDIGIYRQPSGKRLHLWALEGDCDPAGLRSNLFEMEWPPRSGKMARFPEVDRAEWFGLEQARAKVNPAQAAFIDALAGKI